MRHLKLGYVVVITLLIATTNVWAAEGVRHDNSGIYVWVFLGMCALIVVAQLVPAFMKFLGFIRALVYKKEEVPAVESTTSTD